MKTILFFSLILSVYLFSSCTKKPETQNKLPETSNLIQVENNPELTGVSFLSNLASQNKDGIVLFRNGSIGFETTLNPKKKNSLVIEGSGSLINNESVKVDVIANDIKIDQIEFSKSDFEVKKIKLKTDINKLTVHLIFTNDYYNKDTKEDRNFILKSISIK